MDVTLQARTNIANDISDIRRDMEDELGGRECKASLYDVKTKILQIEDTYENNVSELAKKIEILTEECNKLEKAEIDTMSIKTHIEEYKQAIQDEQKHRDDEVRKLNETKRNLHRHLAARMIPYLRRIDFFVEEEKKKLRNDQQMQLPG